MYSVGCEFYVHEFEGHRLCGRVRELEKMWEGQCQDSAIRMLWVGGCGLGVGGEDSSDITAGEGGLTIYITIVPIVFMAWYVMILRRAVSITRVIIRGGP